MGIIGKGSWSYAFDTYMKTTYEKKYEELGRTEEIVMKLFTVLQSKKQSEYSFTGGSIGALEKWNGQVAYTEVNQNYKSTFTHDKYSSGMQIERDALDDDEVGALKGLPDMLALAVRTTREASAESVFTNAFNTGFTLADGQPLCSNSHPKSPTDSSVQDNLGAGALAPATLQAARIAMRKFTNDKNIRLNLRPDTLVVSVDNEDTALEILGSKGKLAVATNDINVNEGRFKLMVLPFTNDTNDWFLIDSKRAPFFLKWYDRRKPDYMSSEEFNTETSRWAVITRFSFGATSWEWIHGTQV